MACGSATLVVNVAESPDDKHDGNDNSNNGSKGHNQAQNTSKTSAGVVGSAEAIASTCFAKRK
jgi:hypothetical protein